MTLPQTSPPAPLLNVNGELLPLEKARVSVSDRSYLYGDSLYEVARTYDGQLIFLREHTERLWKSAALCRMTIDQSPALLEAEMQRTLAHWQATWRASRPLATETLPEAYCRVILSRGEGKIGFSEKARKTPTLYTIWVQAIEPPSAAQLQAGVSLHLSSRLRNDRRALDPAMKSGNYLNSLLAFLEAEERGHADALLVDSQGFLTEGTTFNVFYIKRGIVVTPPLDVGILDGITRRAVLELCRSQGIPTREVRFKPDRLWEADEVFITGTVREIFPVTQIDTQKIGRKNEKGKAGPLTTLLFERFRKRIPHWLEHGLEG